MYRFRVEDMTCGGCAASVRKAVLGVPGVNKIDTNPASRSVVVDASAGVSRERIVAAITDAGYTEIISLDEETLASSARS